MKNKLKTLKISFACLTLVASLASIVVCSYFISKYQLINQLIDSLDFWIVFAYVIGLILGITLFLGSILVLIQFLYVKITNNKLKFKKDE